MPTGTAGLAAQELPFCAVNYTRRPIAFNSAGITSASTFVVATLPANTFIREAIIRVTTLFNDSGTDTLIIGDSSTTNNVAQIGDSDLQTVGTYIVSRGAGLAIAAAKNFYAQYAGQNSNATTGLGYVIITHMPNVDKQS